MKQGAGIMTYVVNITDVDSAGDYPPQYESYLFAELELAEQYANLRAAPGIYIEIGVYRGTIPAHWTIFCTLPPNTR